MDRELQVRLSIHEGKAVLILSNGIAAIAWALSERLRSYRLSVQSPES